MSKYFLLILILMLSHNCGAYTQHPNKMEHELVFIANYINEAGGHLVLREKVSELGNQDVDNAKLLRKWHGSKDYLRGNKNSVPFIRSLAVVVFTQIGEQAFSLSLLEDKKTIVVNHGRLVNNNYVILRDGDYYSIEDEVMGAKLYAILLRHHPKVEKIAHEFEAMRREATK